MQKYEKPMLETIEMRVEERIAKNSQNCSADRGVGSGCGPALKPSNDDADPQ